MYYLEGSWPLYRLIRSKNPLNSNSAILVLADKSLLLPWNTDTNFIYLKTVRMAGIKWLKWKTPSHREMTVVGSNMGNQGVCQGGVCSKYPQFRCHCSGLPFCHDCLSLHLRSFRSEDHSPVSLRPSESSAVVGMAYEDLVLLELIYRTPEAS